MNSLASLGGGMGGGMGGSQGGMGGGMNDNFASDSMVSDDPLYNLLVNVLYRKPLFLNP